jgi:mannose-6-phosphate isomerase-like protein (cupin superfamily)
MPEETQDTEIKAMRIDDIEAVEGFFEGFSFHRVRAALGVSSFGLSIIDMPPNTTDYPEHDHAPEEGAEPTGNKAPNQLGQEEVYLALRGSAVVRANDREYELGEGDIIRVGAAVSRKVLPGDEGVRLLAIGGVPGKAYEPS